MSLDYDKLEAAGHDLTLLSFLAGVSTYFCEHCGAIVRGGPGDEVLFHAPRLVRTAEGACLSRHTAIETRDALLDALDAAKRPPLRDRLKEVDQRRWAELDEDAR